MSNGGIKARAHRGKLGNDTNTETTELEFVTAQPSGPSRVALDMIQKYGYYVSQANNPEAATTNRVIQLTGHGAKRGDFVRFTSSAVAEYEIAIEEVIDANNFRLAGTLSAVPAGGDTFDLLRLVTPRASADGGTATGPLEFELDGTSVTVNEDTGTPANNRPLPVKLTGITGDVTITAQDLDIQSSHTGGTPDSIQIGDGTEVMAINASNEAQVRDDDANTTLTAINDKLVSGTDIGDVTINNAAGASAVNIQDGGNSLTVDDGGVALEVEATNLDIRDLTHVAGQDSVQIGDGTETVAINASNEMQVRDDDTNTALSTLSGKFGALGRKAAVGSAPVVLSTEDKAALDAIKDAVELIDDAISGTEMRVAVISSALPTGAATETSLSSVNTKLPASLGAKTMAGSLSVTVATNQTPIPVETLDIVGIQSTNFASTPVGSAAYVTIIASTAAAYRRVHVNMTSGVPLLLATGAAASEVDVMIIPPGADSLVLDIAVPAATRISLKALNGGETASAGQVFFNFMG